jgi:hypothetical protein
MALGGAHGFQGWIPDGNVRQFVNIVEQYCFDCWLMPVPPEFHPCMTSLFPAAR